LSAATDLAASSTNSGKPARSASVSRTRQNADSSPSTDWLKVVKSPASSSVMAA
jgi:hypothetical protein